MAIKFTQYRSTFKCEYRNIKYICNSTYIIKFMLHKMYINELTFMTFKKDEGNYIQYWSQHNVFVKDMLRNGMMSIANKDKSIGLKQSIWTYVFCSIVLGLFLILIQVQPSPLLVTPQHLG